MPGSEKPIAGVQNVILEQLNRDLAELEKKLEADVVSMMGPIVGGLDDRIRMAVERLDARAAKLAVLLDTPGGVVEVVERIVGVLRHHYREVVFVIPGRAMSAGTVLALSGDAILMDYYSVLGPIDPQVQKDGKLIPALAYLIQFDDFIKKSTEGRLTTAEMVLLQKLDLGELHQFREARDLSIELLKKWLVTYKFKDWQLTETRREAVTPEMKEARADKIANALNNIRRWHTHGRGIPMKVLREELDLRIDDFGQDPTLARRVHEYTAVLREFMLTLQAPMFVHRPRPARAVRSNRRIARASSFRGASGVRALWAPQVLPTSTVPTLR